MAKVIWPGPVIRQLDEVVAYIAQDDPIAAARIGVRLVALGESLAEFPHRGRPARGGAREMTTLSPYVLRYHLVDDIVVIADIRHGARRPLD